MASLNLSGISVTKPKFRYSITELVDDFLKKKLDKEVRDYAKNELGIDYVYKSYDLSRVDFSKDDFLEPDIPLNDLYFQAAKKSLTQCNLDDIGLFVTINDNQEYLDPSPTVELIPKLSFKKNIRTQNFQGMACSAFSEALLNSAGNFLLSGNEKTLVLIGTYYTPWFLDRIKQLKRISKKDKSDFYNLIYFLIFSDVVASVIISPKKTSDTQFQVNPEHILTLKDTKKASKKPTIKISSDKKHRMIFDMKLQPQKLKESVANLSYENIKFLQKKFPSEFKKIKIWGLHTAGSRFVDYITEKCQIENSKVNLTYDLMKKTGNTGAVSSLQFLRECRCSKFPSVP
jgi:3-oxoacyl-[acyl-carrier-protein] synthase III